MHPRHLNFYKFPVSDAVNVDRTRDLQIFSLTLSQLNYPHHMWSALYMYEVTFKQTKTIVILYMYEVTLRQTKTIVI